MFEEVLRAPPRPRAGRVRRRACAPTSSTGSSTCRSGWARSPRRRPHLVGCRGQARHRRSRVEHPGYPGPPGRGPQVPHGRRYLHRRPRPSGRGPRHLRALVRRPRPPGVGRHRRRGRRARRRRGHHRRRRRPRPAGRDHGHGPAADGPSVPRHRDRALRRRADRRHRLGDAEPGRRRGRAGGHRLRAARRGRGSAGRGRRRCAPLPGPRLEHRDQHRRGGRQHRPRPEPVRRLRGRRPPGDRQPPGRALPARDPRRRGPLGGRRPADLLGVDADAARRRRRSWPPCSGSSPTRST